MTRFEVVLSPKIANKTVTLFKKDRHNMKFRTQAWHQINYATLTALQTSQKKKKTITADFYHVFYNV